MGYKDPEKQRAYQRAWKKQKHASGTGHIHEKRLWIREQKSKPCADCGGVFHWCAMDFDHRPGETKLFAIAASKGMSWNALRAEIAKCDVVCANCHRIRTFTRKPLAVQSVAV